MPQNGFDKHKLDLEVPRAGDPQPQEARVSEGQCNCGDHYKAIVAGFSIPQNVGDMGSYYDDGEGLIDPPTSLNAFNNVFYLGMDPRPKSRAYRFLNDGTSTDPVTFRLSASTTGPPKPGSSRP